MPNYGDVKYWEQRYEDQMGSTFDWLEDYETLKPIFEGLKFKKSDKILNLGCGNSEFCERMYDDGFEIQYNIDICENVIKYMSERNSIRNKMKFEIMDVRELLYEDDIFDIVIDKSTMDALLCGDHSFLYVSIMLKEVQRVLKTGGFYVIISYGVPDNRIIHLEREHLAFEVEIYTIKKESEIINDKEKMHYAYICKKKEESSLMKQNFENVYKELEKQELDELIEDDENDENEEEAEIFSKVKIFDENK